ncbi:MAG: hypothetical protein LBJ35_07470 [Spirochaetaceae bacterium]|jgi:hypothetical protein|nr:hypothetical protein [Spirochaetaceae bacterium]
MKRLLFYAASAGLVLLAASCAEPDTDIATSQSNVGNYSIRISSNVETAGGSAFTDRTKANQGVTVTLTVTPPQTVTPSEMEGESEGGQENSEGGGGGSNSLDRGKEHIPTKPATPRQT